jgi:peptidylprolyl isomerase
MTRLRRLAVPALAALALFAAGCGDEEEEPAGTTEPAAAETETPTPEPEPTETAEEGGDLKDTKTKPAIAKPSGDPPTELEKKDIVKGKGKAAKSGDQVTVQYVGVSYSTGEEFDASWDRGEPFPFQLGGGQVIQGWEEGIVGMKVGGRRQLTIPPEMGYGATGSPPAIGPNETLIFVVDLLEIS